MNNKNHKVPLPGHFSSVINKLIEEANITAAHVARHCNIPESTVRRLRNDCDANPTASNLIALSQFFGISIDDMLGCNPKQKSSVTGGTFPSEHQFNKLPILNWVNVIDWGHSSKTSKNYININPHEIKAHFAIMVPGLEYDHFRTQSLAIVNTEKKISHRSYVICHKAGQERATLKMLIRHEGESYLDPLNSKFNMIKLSKQYTLIGTVIEFRMNVNNTDYL